MVRIQTQKQVIMKNFITAYGKKSRCFSKQNSTTSTRQAHKDDCDVNRIMSRYRQTGLIAHVAKHQGQYLDVPDGVTYESALQTVIDARESFDTLPSEVRDRYRNDPIRFLDALTDPSEKQFLTDAGLFKSVKKPPTPGEAVGGVDGGDGVDGGGS